MLVWLVACTPQGRVPVADAGVDRLHPVTAPVPLDGSGSRDPAGHPLVFHWSLAFVPEGSALAPGEAAFPANHGPAPRATFTPDVLGSYVVELVVENARGERSLPDAVIVIAEDNLVPTLDLGPPRVAAADAAVTVVATTTPGGTTTWTVEDPDGGARTLEDKGATVTVTPTAPGITRVAAVATVDDVPSRPATLDLLVPHGGPPPALALQGPIETCTPTPLALETDAAVFWGVPSGGDPQVSLTTQEGQTTLVVRSVGEHVVGASVARDGRWSEPALAAVSVVPRAKNDAPVVTLAPTRTVDVAVPCNAEDGAWRCTECVALVDLQATAEDADGDDLTLSWEVQGDAVLVGSPGRARARVSLGAPGGPDACSSRALEVALTATDCPGAATTARQALEVSCCGVVARRGR